MWPKNTLFLLVFILNTSYFSMFKASQVLIVYTWGLFFHSFWNLLWSVNCIYLLPPPFRCPLSSGSVFPHVPQPKPIMLASTFWPMPFHLKGRFPPPISCHSSSPSIPSNYMYFFPPLRPFWPTVSHWKAFSDRPHGGLGCLAKVGGHLKHDGSLYFLTALRSFTNMVTTTFLYF